MLAPVRASLAAIGRARVAVLTIAATYVISVSVGIAMATTGNTLALQRRDDIVLRRPGANTWLGLPQDAMRDVALAYVLIVPLFLVASLWEFLMR